MIRRLPPKRSSLLSTLTRPLLASTRIPVPVKQHLVVKKSERSTSIIELQPYKKEGVIAGGAGGALTIKLVNLNPNIGAWYLLSLKYKGKTVTYHLENPTPRFHQISLDSTFPHGVVVSEGALSIRCELWDEQGAGSIEAAAKEPTPFVSLCDKKLFLRNQIEGHRSTKEQVVDFLRDNVWGGEGITSFVKQQFFKDKFLLERDGPTGKKDSVSMQNISKIGPPAAKLRAGYASEPSKAVELGIKLLNAPDNQLAIGEWYRAQGSPGVFVSMIEPDAASPLDSNYKLDAVEKKALTYLVGFDLGLFELGYTLGTDHPRVDWSTRVRPGMRNNSKPGPDGIGEKNPLVTTGLVSPADLSRVAATFTGGFKRTHGAFKWGALAQRNHGSHYGFMENGVVFSRLQPGLATVMLHRDGSVDLKTWREGDEASLSNMLGARQNGVAIVEYDATTNASSTGALVSRWGPGNWSGSQDSKFRSLRAGTCIVETAGRQFLYYGYFSSATPAAMARVFRAYGCRYAMHLDMNALEHTYLALYPHSDGQLKVEHLIKGMDVLDRPHKGQPIARFLGQSDNRDFFYLKRRKTQ